MTYGQMIFETYAKASMVAFDWAKLTDMQRDAWEAAAETMLNRRASERSGISLGWAVRFRNGKWLGQNGAEVDIRERKVTDIEQAKAAAKWHRGSKVIRIRYVRYW